VNSLWVVNQSRSNIGESISYLARAFTHHPFRNHGGAAQAGLRFPVLRPDERQSSPKVRHFRTLVLAAVPRSSRGCNGKWLVRWFSARRASINGDEATLGGLPARMLVFSPFLYDMGLSGKATKINVCIGAPECPRSSD
jgi:hypothetical protein